MGSPRSDLSTRQMFEEAVALARGGEPVIIQLPTHLQAKFYQDDFTSRHRIAVTRSVGVAYVGDTQVRFAYRETDLRGLCAHLFRWIPDSRDFENNYMWRFVAQWPGAYPPAGPPSLTRFERLDHITI